MIEMLSGAPDGVLAFDAIGEVQAEDYETVLRPAIDAAVAEHGKIRVVFRLGPRYTSYSVRAGWEDLKLGASHLTAWQRCAVVTDHSGIASAVRAFGLLLPGEFAVFPVAELNRAYGWVSA